MSDETFEPRSVTMNPIHWATIDSYAKDTGYPSTSAALRRIVDEWVQLKQAELARTNPPRRQLATVS